MKTLTLILSLFILSCSDEKQDIVRIEQLGKTLMESDSLTINQPTIPVILIGKGLLNKLSEIKKHTKSYNIKVTKGDFNNPFGDNQADYILFIDNDFQNIGIRLKKNIQEDKFDILGWKTLDK